MTSDAQKPIEMFNDLMGSCEIYGWDKEAAIIYAALEKADKVDELVAALEIIAKRPDLPNSERDADWKNCMKWSSYEAREALSKFRNEG